jgi:hypothetical protein
MCAEGPAPAQAGARPQSGRWRSAIPMAMLSSWHPKRRRRAIEGGARAINRCRWVAIYTALVCLAATGCTAEIPIPTHTPTSAPVAPTPSLAFPTLRPSPTWSPIPMPSRATTSGLNLGAVWYADDFSQEGDWNLGEDLSGATSIADGHLTLAVRQAGAFRLAKSPAQAGADFFFQVSVNPELCSPGDVFGVAFRIGANDQHYRYGLTCEGGVRAFRFSPGDSASLALLEASNAIIPGPDVTNRLGVSMEGERMRFFVNDIQILSTHDAALTQGGFGLFVRAAGGQQLTVSFDDLEIWHLVSTGAGTPTADER